MKIGPPWSALRARPALPGELALLVAPLLILPVFAFLAADLFRSTGDVELYAMYARGALSRPIELPREYPPLAAAIFVLPALLAPLPYFWGFALLAAAATGVILCLVERWGGAGWLLLLLLSLGAWGTLFFRFDVVVVLLTVLAFRSVERGRFGQAQLLLLLAAALKLYPLVLMPLVVLAEWRERRRVDAALGSGLLLVPAAALMWLLAPEASVGMLRYWGERPLQIESLGATLAWLLGPAATELSYGSTNLVSPAAPVVAAVLRPLAPILLLLPYAAYARGRLAAAPAWALCLVVLVASSKVFSTQYLLWPLPFVALAIQRSANGDRPAHDQRWLWIVLCALTGLIYPLGELWWSRTAQLTVLAIRNMLWLVAAAALWHSPALRSLPARLWHGLLAELRWWRSRPFVIPTLVLLIVIADIASLARAGGRVSTLDVGAWNDEESARLLGFHRRESSDASYRWTSASSLVTIHSALLLPHAELELVVGGLPAAEPRAVTLHDGNAPLVALPVAPAQRRYSLLLPSAALDAERVWVHLYGPTSALPEDSRPLGLRLDAIRLRLPATRWLVPSWHTLLLQITMLLCCAAMLRRLPLPGPAFAALLLVAVGALAYALGNAPFGIAFWQSRGLAWSALALLLTVIIIPARSDPTTARSQ